MRFRIGLLRKMDKYDLDQICREWLEAYEENWYPSIQVSGNRERIAATLRTYFRR